MQDLGRGACYHARTKKLTNSHSTANLMQVMLNGEAANIAPNCSLAQLLEQAQMTGKRIAVELNGEIVPKSQHIHTTLNDADRIEIVHAIGGG